MVVHKPIPRKLEYSETHRDIVERCQRGERRAQFELYQQYSRAMYNICLRIVRIEHDAEDVLQAAFIDIFTKIDQFRFESSIGAWIKRIVVNNCINHLKRRKLNTEAWDDRYDALEDPDPPVTEGLSVGRVKQAMEHLPDGYRVVFNLYVFEGYDHQEIGEILHITEATSKSQYCRARKKLKTLLQSGANV